MLLYQALVSHRPRGIVATVVCRIRAFAGASVVTRQSDATVCEDGSSPHAHRCAPFGALQRFTDAAVHWHASRLQQEASARVHLEQRDLRRTLLTIFSGRLRPFARRVAPLVAGAFVVAMTMSARAGNFECTASIVNVLIYKSGDVNVLHSGRGDYTVMCNLITTRDGVDPTVCATWYALLQTVKNKHGTVDLWFSVTDPVVVSCATLPTYWSAPGPYYVGDVTSP